MRKNAFTLIELLAVIVVLAIIALIATPIILGIVEDAKKDTFLRSVELVISTTDIDISNKTFEEEYTYTMTDGVISDLELGIKNTKGMNGTITYDYEGNETYAIHNGSYCVKKTADMTKAEISDYVEGECTLQIKEVGEEILTSINSKVPNVGDIESYEKGKLINLGTYGIRYQGSNPDNYVYFNCEDYSNQTSETCELWRIIGIVDEKVKIMSAQSLEELYIGPANWSNSDLNTYLNGDYYNNLKGSTQNYILPSTLYLRTTDTVEITKASLYDLERTSGTVLSNASVDGVSVGIMYASDYGYAAMENNTCTADALLGSSYASLGCATNNWIFIDSKNYGESLMTIMPTDYCVYAISPYYRGLESVSGILISGEQQAYNPNNRCGGFNAKPTVYLNDNVLIKGSGTIVKPYQLSLK